MGNALGQVIRSYVIVAALLPSVAMAQLFSVESLDKESSSAATMTFLYPAKDAKATLIFVPGGDGSVGVKPTWNASHRYFSTYHYNRMLQSLSDSTVTSGLVNVVIFDSPVSLGSTGWPAARAGVDHLARIESVLRFYADMLKKPVWLMGHSNGGISVTEFDKYLLKNHQEGLLAGLIYSGGRDGATFDEHTKLPVLLIHHERDGCDRATPDNTQRLYAKLKETGHADVDFALIKSGASASGNACHSGYHMYFGAAEEVAGVIDRFLAKHLH